MGMITKTHKTVGSSRPWIARITGTDAKFEFAREFERGVTDPRGTVPMTTWELDDGLYEEQSPARGRRFFQVEGENDRQLAICEVRAALGCEA